MTPRLKSEFWINALVRRVQSMGGFATVIRKGDPDAGITLIVIRSGQDLSLYAPERNFMNERVWWPECFEDHSALDIRLNRRIDDDPDIWVVEVESDVAPESLIGETIETAKADQDPKEAAVQAAAQALFRAK